MAKDDGGAASGASDAKAYAGAKRERGFSPRPVLGGGLIALMALSAAAYFYWAWDASRAMLARSTAAPTTTAPAARPVISTVAAAPAEVAAADRPDPQPDTRPLAATPTPGPTPVTIVQAAPPSPPPDTAPPVPMQDQSASLPRPDVVFVQKPGVRMRAEPSKRSKVVASPLQGAQLTVLKRSGSWVQVEGEAGKGWIGGRLLGPERP